MYVYALLVLLSPLIVRKISIPWKNSSIETHEGAPLTKKPVPRLILNFPFLFSPGGHGLSGGSFSVCISNNTSTSVLRHKERNTWRDKSGCTRVYMHAHESKKILSVSANRAYNIIERREYIRGSRPPPPQRYLVVSIHLPITLSKISIFRTRRNHSFWCTYTRFRYSFRTHSNNNNNYSQLLQERICYSYMLWIIILENFRPRDSGIGTSPLLPSSV